MLKFMSKWLKVYQDEIGLFLWCAILLFLIRSSNILFNNFVETAFLKRFGVEYLPMIYMINSIATFFIMGLISGVMGRLPGSRLLAYMLLFSGCSVGALRFAIPLGFDLLYPLLYLLKMQYEVLLGLFFWNLANDLFNTRQSKRLFPLITAGGVLGGITGSFGTPFLAEAIPLDNLMFAYLITTVLGAMAVKRMGTLFPTLLISHKKPKKTKSGVPLVEEFKKILPLIKESRLVKILIVLTLMPNVVIPIMNYQFNFAIDQQFATEGGMIRFFGYFRGVLNVVSLIILLFVGRIYGRWGLPVALMFHPFNYLLAFTAFLLRFDIFSAMYARISTNVLRTTINNPARAVLFGLFPASYRGVIRPFLRGTVVRVGILTGSGFIMLSEGVVHPRYLSLVASMFVGTWILTSVILKRRYSKILLDLISRNMLDLKSMEEKDVGQVFKDKKVQSQLLDAFLSARNDDCLWYARLLRSLGVKELDQHILSIIKGQDDATRIGLLRLLSPNAGQEALKIFRELADPRKPELMVAIMKTAYQLSPEVSSGFAQEVFESDQHPEVKAYALIGLHKKEPQKYKGIIDSWLVSEKAHERKAGVIAAGESGDSSYISILKQMLKAEERDASILHFLLKGLQRLKAEKLNSLILPYLSHSVETVRLAALEAFEINDDNSLRRAVARLGDESAVVQELAKSKVQTSSYHNAQVLVESLTIPRHRVREGIFDILESLNIKDLDVFRFARAQLEKGYFYLAEAESLLIFPPSPARDLLIDHLEQKRKLRLENIIRVLVTQDSSGKMRIIWRGVSSSDQRQRSNSLEALEQATDRSLTKIMMPLLENLPASQCLEIGAKHFQLPVLDSNKHALYSHLLEANDWVTIVLTLYLVAHQGLDGLDSEVLQKFAQSKNAHIRQMAQSVMDLHY